jgi:DNA polymerase-3 subunit alpha
MGSTATKTEEKSSSEAEALLWEWLRFGWNYRRIGERPQEHQDWYAGRVRYEMEQILGKGLADFFLFTSDAIRWGKDNGVAFGPGRGSTAASVVAWLLRITEIDPQKYPGLVFERFLDLSRPDPPDIDVDCSDEDRWRVREYLEKKYGSDCVGSIANFIRYRGKNSLQDVCKVYNIPIWVREAVANCLIERSGGDSRFDATLEDTFEMFDAAKEAAEQYPDIMKACRLEGDVRGMGVHAAGLIVANSPLTEICAEYEKDGRRSLSIDKYDAEYVGALKLDFLGLTTMGMIARCLRMVGLTLEDLYAIPDTDWSAIDVFRRNDVVGVFQFEGRATRLVCRDVYPEHFAHITHINALSRPGPLFSGQTAAFIAVRHGREKAERLHPMVDEITADTYGQIIYQEQILRILKEMGGFDWFSVSQIRRIISKKMGEAAFQMSYEQFAQGALDNHGVNRELADRIWRRLVTSGTYSFNIAHAISYSMLAFWTAWLKAHYPLEFYAASLSKASIKSKDKGDADTAFRLMRDALGHSIDVRPPAIGVSEANWVPASTPNGPAVIAGFRQIPGIGEKMAPQIVAAEPADGWKNWSDLKIVPGIGDKTIQSMEAFAEARDPFQLYRTERRLKAVRRFLGKQKHKAVPLPTMDSDQLAAMDVRKYEWKPGKRFVPGPFVIYMGMVRRVEYKDIVEDERSRTGKEIEDILKELKRPDLIKRATLHFYDTGQEEVYGRINRWKFPRLARTLETIRVNHDVVVIAGNRIAGFGTPVMVDDIWVIDPD